MKGYRELNRKGVNIVYVILRNPDLKVSEDIPLICVCGNHDVGDIPNRRTVRVVRRVRSPFEG